MSADTAGRLLHELMQQALRVGKRAHAETGIDRAGQSVVTAALDLAAAQLDGDLAGRPALVIGAGAMGALAVATLSRLGAGPLAVTNRGADRAVRLAESYGAERGRRSSRADRGAVHCGHRSGRHRRPPKRSSPATWSRPRSPPATPPAGRWSCSTSPCPATSSPRSRELPGVEVIDIERLGRAARRQLRRRRRRRGRPASSTPRSRPSSPGCAAPTSARPSPPCAARADDVVTAELRRLAQRRPDLTDDQRADVARTVHRVVQRLLHQPTVRVRQLAAEPGGDQYAALLRELFDLDVPAERAGRRRHPTSSAVPPATGAAR